ncbi:MAG: ATP-binding cassette domain-containing protein [Melioribacteraceae bacterium]|nr:ATP-binding cassette domain-containing protein [Melioribacteraceae bacterium]MCF8355229.1 ATP-binding cassette domain-containing protein [Melioribacteraceae bacterium]MCF8395216.1 ATP-binding cassette domain-containing protein [Melioribacteraceae bacterium]MCF8420690.1 ATP-binding cassette domain-containing protein [Melioribacteraceae bacterium]
MISTSNLTLRFGKRTLFEEVNLKFTPGNCYGIIGANGSGKSTFIKILSGEIEQSSGDVIITPGSRLTTLKQNQFEYDEYQVIKTVIMGHKKLYSIMEERDLLYAKPDFSDEDGIRASELEGEFAEMYGWEAESEAAELLSGLGLNDEYHNKLMKDLSGNEKVKVLLAQALFGNPDILLLDEPTNHLDIISIGWLEDFLSKFKNTVIVISHDRHFLNQVCTHIADIDFGQIQMYTGNYDFWLESSQLAAKQAKESNKKIEAKRAELQEFINRFSANASKSKQATSRKKQLENLTLEDIKPSSRKMPYIAFKPEREAGDNLLEIRNISQKYEGEFLLNDLSFKVETGDKIAFVGPNDLAKTTLFNIIAGNEKSYEGNYSWGVTTKVAYFPKDNEKYFDVDMNLIDWLRQFSKEKEETYIRGFLGRMLFSGEESLKSARVLSGGERVRCLFAKMMLTGANVLILDEPTNHLDLEAISALNNALIDFPGTVLFSSHDHQFMQSIAERIIEIVPSGIIDKRMTFDEYLADAEINKIHLDVYYQQAINI